jgi:phosphatidylserine decarboxylase
MLKWFANYFWLYAPGDFQKKVSTVFATFFKFRFSRYFIFPYGMMFGLSSEYLAQFKSYSENAKYSSFSDFFERRYKTFPTLTSKQIFPCEGYVCDWGSFSDKNSTSVKSQQIDLNTIFLSSQQLTKNYFFTNIFLHNHNYHRIHAPIAGTVLSVRRVPGVLNFLRPWFYERSDISFPAFRNERVIFEIADSDNKIWYVAMVGGFGVGTIELSVNTKVGAGVALGQELAMFKLGSTVCIASPDFLNIEKYLMPVKVGDPLIFKKGNNHVS